MSLVASIVELLLRKLANPLIQEAIFLYGVRDQVELLVLEFERMVAFLEDADAKQEGDRRVKRWVQHVRDAAYDAEDVIDTFILKIITSKRRGFLGSIRRYACIPNELIDLHEVGSEIQRIDNKIRRISESRSTYGIVDVGQGAGTTSAGPSRQEWRLTSPDLEEADFVGFEKDLEELFKRLTNERELRRCVVSVVGMGGLGKTTLTKKVYNQTRVQAHFNFCEWISISQEYGVRDILQNFITYHKVLSEEEDLKKMGKLNVNQLKHKISEYLKAKRYLIVLDDIWTNQAWDAVKDAFPDMDNGSRVMLTTRNRAVASYADARSQPHELRFLSNEESWDLFCKKTFLAQDGRCPQNLEELGKNIVDKCGGLPLAVVVIGGLLSTKEVTEWENVYKSISWQLVRGEFKISHILALSYKDLPYYLKPCFLYLGNFPEDYEFQANELIQLWAAEGFLEERGEETLEEVGEDYLKELIQRSMVQVAERSLSRGIKRCRIHDLLRDLSISEAKEGMFLQVHRGTKNAPPESRARRLAIHHNATSKYISLNCSAPHIRSVLIYTQGEAKLHREEKKFLCGGFKLLRVLYLHGTRIKKLPSEIGGLVHLRYLGCTDTSLQRLPSSIGNLENLQTLFVTSRRSKIEVPSTIGKIQQLRHLQLKGIEGWNRIRGVIKGQPRLERISNLQTLSKVKAGKWMEDGCLGKLTNLRKLGIVIITKADGKVFSDYIVGKTKGSLVPPFSHLLKLTKLYLKGRLEKLPESHEFPANLTKLTLEDSCLEEDPLATLEKLKNLRILRLLDASYWVKEMVCSAQGFPRLESLHLELLYSLEEWRVEEGAMPCLLHLRIINCQRLKKLPEGLQHVNTLNKLELSNMSYEFHERVREARVEGEDWHKIRHIPSIDIKWRS